MMKLKRLVFGVLSSLLLTAGFAQAADELDPMSRSLARTRTDPTLSGALDCAGFCDAVDCNR